MTQILWGWSSNSQRLKSNTDSGFVLLGGSSTPQNAPLDACLKCNPIWNEIHKLAIQEADYQFQMEQALVQSDFELAEQYKNTRQSVRKQLQSKLESIGLQNSV